MKYFFLFALLLTSAMRTYALDQVEFPENARVLSMGGAYLAVADDPQAGFINPAGLRLLKQVGYELSYDGATSHVPDHYAISLANPGTEHGAAFAMGGWIQGLSEHRRQIYYVPFTGTSWSLTSSTMIGVVTRFPYLKSEVDSIKSRWETLADVTALQTFQAIHLAASVERAFGGGSDIVPRRLRLGAAIVSEAGIIVSYEYRANETARHFNFHFNNSRIGAEARIGDYVALRGGYVTGDLNRIAAGAAIGLLKQGGWRFEAGWELPTAGHGYTRWAIGMGYRT
jgi:hypothetical protein